MLDEKVFDEAKKRIEDKYEYKINDLGYELSFASTTTEELEPGIVAIIHGSKVSNMTPKDVEKITLSLPDRITHKEATYSVRVSYIKK